MLSTYTGGDEGRDGQRWSSKGGVVGGQRLVAGGTEADLVELGSAALPAPSC